MNSSATLFDLLASSRLYAISQGLLLLIVVVNAPFLFTPSRRTAANRALLNAAIASFLLGVGTSAYHMIIPFLRLASGKGAEPALFAMEMIKISFPLWISSLTAFVCVIPETLRTAVAFTSKHPN